jgi:hypothetical protein
MIIGPLPELGVQDSALIRSAADLTCWGRSAEHAHSQRAVGWSHFPQALVEDCNVLCGVDIL